MGAPQGKGEDQPKMGVPGGERPDSPPEPPKISPALGGLKWVGLGFTNPVFFFPGFLKGETLIWRMIQCFGGAYPQPLQFQFLM